MIPCLGDAPDAPFPPLDQALENPDGLLAWGGDLSPDRLLLAYRGGVFPWFMENDPILWWSPGTRCLIPTGKLHVSRRLQRTLRQQRYTFSMDTAFDQVVKACITTRRSTWISRSMQQAYSRLHRLGYGHSIEVWRGDQLRGGLYGLAIGRMFAGESMFSTARDTSKMALAMLCRALCRWQYPWLDAQMPTPHLLSLGGVQMPREVFIGHLEECLQQPDETGSWTERFAEFQLLDCNKK